MNRIDNLEYISDNFLSTPPDKILNSTLSEVTSLIFSEISDLNYMLSPYRKQIGNSLALQHPKKDREQKEKVLIVDITNDIALILFPYFGYRTHHEFFIESIRLRIGKLVDIRYRILQLFSKEINKKLSHKVNEKRANDEIK